LLDGSWPPWIQGPGAAALPPPLGPALKLYYVARFLKKIKDATFKLFKKTEKNSRGRHVVFYQRAKFQLKMPYNCGCAKMIKPDIYNSEHYKLSKSQNLSGSAIFVQH
jgi:hypothetical protein